MSADGKAERDEWAAYQRIGKRRAAEARAELERRKEQRRADDTGGA